MRSLAIVALLATHASADECSDRHPEGMPVMGFLDKTRLEIGGAATTEGFGGTLSAEKLWHPQVDAGLRLDFTRPWDTAQGFLDVVVEGRVFLFMVSGGVGSDGVCGMKGHDWRWGGAPYLAVGVGGWMTQGFDAGGFATLLGLGWDEIFGRELSVFGEAGRVIETGRHDAWSVRAGVRF